MWAAYPPAENLYGRFARTTRIDVRRNALVRQDDAAGTAEVSVDVAETLRGGAGRHYVGTWSLVRGPHGWLIDAPHLDRVPSWRVALRGSEELTTRNSELGTWNSSRACYALGGGPLGTVGAWTRPERRASRTRAT